MRAVEEIVALGGDADARPSAAYPAATPAVHRAWTTSPTGSRTGSRPGSGSTSGGRKGKVTVEFASLDDLERIVGVIDPPTDRRRRLRSASPS